MNLDFTNDNYRFNARVSAIIYDKTKTKVLLFKVNDSSDFYMLPGGRIMFDEDSFTAIKREIKEELNFELNYKLCAIQENFINKNNINIMQYCFCYKAIYDGIINDKVFNCLDSDGQVFEWVNIDEIYDYKILPLSNKELIINQTIDIKHIIDK